MCTNAATQLIGLVAKQHLGEQRVLARFWERHNELRPSMPRMLRSLRTGIPGIARRTDCPSRIFNCWWRILVC